MSIFYICGITYYKIEKDRTQNIKKQFEIIWLRKIRHKNSDAIEQNATR